MLTASQQSLVAQHRPRAVLHEVRPPPVPTILTAAQQTWLRLFDRVHANINLRLNTNHSRSEAIAPPNDLPLVGGDYDVVEPLSWPTTVYYVPSNVFLASQPFPTSDKTSSDRYNCGCDGNRCIADNGTRLNSGCANAGMDIVCDDTNCSVGEACGNRFTPRFDLDLITTRVGLGVVCSSPIPKGAFVVEYVGELLLDKDAMTRPDRRYQVQLKTKAQWDDNSTVFIDAAECGNKSRFINHSCRPNCALYEWQWTNGSRLGVFAEIDIPPLQELTFRYSEKSLTLFTCQCGHTNCVTNHQ